MSEHRDLVEGIEAILYDNVISTPRVKVRKVITLILSAVRDGRLDEELGVAGRLEQEPQTRPYAHGVEKSLTGWILNRFKEGARNFIALGKEEEK